MRRQRIFDHPIVSRRQVLQGIGAASLLSLGGPSAFRPAAAQTAHVQWSGVARVVAFADVHGAYAELITLLRETVIVDALVGNGTPGDVVVLASSLIPGNENAVSRVINGLTRWGATVVHKGNAMVHTSGHASAGELLYAYNLVKPRNVTTMPAPLLHLRERT